MTRRNICLVAAAVCFILVAVKCPVRQVDLTATGLALLTIALL